MAAGSGGTCSAMLRSRRRDVSNKPNRVLDRNSSRGMIYENEELMLRTMNINAEVERGQSDIKKLRRENEQLMREIWCLREECDRLTSLLQAQQEDEYEEDDTESADELAKKEWRKSCEDGEEDGLSVLAEEPEEHPSPSAQPNTTLKLQVFENGERRCEKYSGELPPCLRVNCVHPFSVASTIDHQTTPPVTVTEVVEAGWSVVGERLIGVRLLSGGSIYLSVTDTRAVAALVERGLSLREGSLLLPLHDVSQGTVVLALSGVPYTMSDTQLAHTVAQFGPIIGYIETRYYRNVDTGERLARLRPQSSLPKRLYIDGQEISVRILPHDELSKLAQLPAHIGRRSSHRVRLNIPSLKVEVTNLGGGNIAEVPPGGGVEQSTSTPSIVPQPPPTTTSTSANTATSTTANATQQPFTFPVNPPTTPTAQIQQTINKEEGDRSQSLPPGSLPATPSPSTVRRGGSESDVGGSRRIRYRPSRRGRSPEGGTASRAPSCRRRPSTRRSVVAGTQHQETTEQQAGATLGQDRERSGSLASVASARRKLSDTGREVGSLPWCGCWGNGCV